MSTNIDVQEKERKHNTEMTKQRVDYSQYNSSLSGAVFLRECGVKLQCRAQTTATALVLYHRFFAEGQAQNYDVYLIAATCNYLAGKVEDEPLKMRDIINVSHHTLHRSMPPLEHGESYWNMRSSLAQAELLVLRMLRFQLSFNHPHKYLLHYLKSIEDWMGSTDFSSFPIAGTCWKLLQDVYIDPYILTAKPEILSLALINLTFQMLAIQLPHEKVAEVPWYTALCESCSKEALWATMLRLMEVFDIIQDAFSSRVFKTPEKV